MPTTSVGCFTLRPDQVDVVERVVDAFEENRWVLLDAPTGTGKTVIATAVAECIGEAGYSAPSRALQDQYAGDFPHVPMIKGHANYCSSARRAAQAAEFTEGIELPPGADPDAEDDAGGTKVDCDDPECAHEMAMREAEQASLFQTNPWKLLADSRSRSRLSPRDLIVLDEADQIEEVLDKQRERRFKLSHFATRGITVPVDHTDRAGWAEAFKLRAERVQPGPRQGERVAAFLAAMQRCNNLDWTIDIDKSSVVLNQVTSETYAQELLWPTADKFLLMSATLGDGVQLMERLGVAPWEYAHIATPHRTPLEQRSVLVDPVVNARAAAWDDPVAVAKLAAAVQRHREGRTLVHVTSYRQAEALAALIPEAITHGRRDLATGLMLFLSREDGVMITPAGARGLDLPDDDARTVIVAKLPWAPRTPLMVARDRQTSGYYTRQMVQTLVQQCGRGVRHAGDRAKTVIIDAGFASRAGAFVSHAPAWWTKALVW